MRVAVIFLMSVLLVPALSARWRPPNHPHSTPSLSHSTSSSSLHPPSSPHSSPPSRAPSLQSPSTPPLSHTSSPPPSPPWPVTPPSRAPPSPPDSPPPHGRVVRYQGANGPQHGIILGSQPDRMGRHNLAPVTNNWQAGDAIVHYDRIVRAHGGDIVHTDTSVPVMASSIRDAHARNQPTVTQTRGPVEGSARYQAPQSPGHGGHPDAGNHGRGGRRR